eukprot:gene3483-6132_t
MSSKFYAVANGRKIGVFSSWNECEQQVKGFPNAKYKSFLSKIEAHAFVKNPTFKKVKSNIQSNKRKYSSYNNDKAENKKPKLEEDDNFTIIYTDGSCLGNGKKGAVGGVGVFFGEEDSRNLSEKLDDNIFKATNQRAELTGAIRAIEISPDEEDIEIRTDSIYTIKCATEWSKKWVKNDWKTSGNKNVENRDLIEKLLFLIEKKKGIVKFTHIEGHKGHYGNEQADELAVKGSNL